MSLADMREGAQLRKRSSDSTTTCRFTSSTEKRFPGYVFRAEHVVEKHHKYGDHFPQLSTSKDH